MGANLDNCYLYRGTHSENLYIIYYLYILCIIVISQAWRFTI